MHTKCWKLPHNAATVVNRTDEHIHMYKLVACQVHLAFKNFSSSTNQQWYQTIYWAILKKTAKDTLWWQQENEKEPTIFYQINIFSSSLNPRKDKDHCSPSSFIWVPFPFFFFFTHYWKTCPTEIGAIGELPLFLLDFHLRQTGSNLHIEPPISLLNWKKRELPFCIKLSHIMFSCPAN